MLNNLKAEFTRKGMQPYKGVMQALGCSDKTARNKLNGRTPFTIPEAKKIIISYFPEMSIEYLFATNNKSA